MRHTMASGLSEEDKRRKVLETGTRNRSIT